MAQNGPLAAIAALIVVVVIAAGATGGYLYVHSKPTTTSGPRLVQLNDNVTVDYIGIYGSGPDVGKVFDTSLYSVATNNASYPKSLTYHFRGAPGNFTPLAVHVGPSTPSNGYSFAGKSFIQVVPGFWQGLEGFAGNVTHLAIVPPALGYGEPNPACFRTLPLSQQFPIFQTLQGTQFSAKYPGTLATTGASFNDPTYGWKVLILSANATSVSLENVATVGETSQSAGWPTLVTDVTSTPDGTGRITVLNELTPSEAGHIAGHAAQGPCVGSGGGTFIVTAVNPQNGTFTESFNQEVQGAILLFVVTVLNVYAPPKGLVA